MAHKNKMYKYPVDTTNQSESCLWKMDSFGFPHKVHNIRIKKQISIPF